MDESMALIDVNDVNHGVKRKNYRPLTVKQEHFCELVVMGNSHLEAYKMAYETQGYKESSLSSVSSALAVEPRITLRIAALRLPAQGEFQKHRKAWLFELMAMAFVDPGDFFNEHGNPIHIPNLPPAARKMLAGFEICEEFTGKGEARQSVGYRGSRWAGCVRLTDSGRVSGSL